MAVSWHPWPSALDPEQVVREHGPSVLRLLRRIFGPHQDVDDLFQMVFVEVLRSLPRFGGRSKLRTWIRRIAWNVAYQEMRHRYRRPPSRGWDEERDGGAAELAWQGQQACMEEIAGASPEELAAQRQSLRRLYHAMEELEPKLRSVVVMHDLEGLSLKEVGKQLGRPLPTVASRLYAGRAALAEAMVDFVDRKAAQGEKLKPASVRTARKDRR